MKRHNFFIALLNCALLLLAYSTENDGMAVICFVICASNIFATVVVDE